MGSAICSCHEKEEVPIAKGIIPLHSSACMVIHWCYAACCASGIKGLSLGKLQVSRRNMRPSHASFWIQHPQNRWGGHGESPMSNAHVPSCLPPASLRNGQLLRSAKFVGLRKIGISPTYRCVNKNRWRVFVLQCCSLRGEKNRLLTRR